MPRALGHGHRACTAAAHAAGVSLASVSDNPVYVPPGAGHPHGQVLSNGGYHNGIAYPALDGLAVAWEAATNAGEALDANLAILAVVACEALRRAGRPAPPPVRELASQVMSAVAPIDHERPLARDLEQVARAFTARVLSADAAT